LGEAGVRVKIATKIETRMKMGFFKVAEMPQA
jgi:hypothetical protein